MNFTTAYVKTVTDLDTGCSLSQQTRHKMGEDFQIVSLFVKCKLQCRRGAV